MKIAVTYENGNIFQHFGHTEKVKIYEIEDNKVVSEEVLDTSANGHEKLVSFLQDHDVQTLICGGIGGGAKIALTNADIKLCAGVSGNTDEAVNAYLAGNLAYNSNVTCTHHHVDGEHNCADHNRCTK